MKGPLLGKDERKGKLVHFKTSVVPKDKDNVCMPSTAEELPTLLPSICCSENVDIIELYVLHLPVLSGMTCPLTVSNIQQHQAGDQLLVEGD